MRLKVPPDTFVKIAPDQWTQPFWDAAREHRLVCARCRECGRFRMPPSPFCPHCRSQAIDWPELSGEGTVFTYTVVTHPVLPELQPSVPYGVVAVTLPDADGVRLVGNVVGIDSDDLRVGLPVRVQWADIGSGITVPRFVTV